jgi:putative ABC transport system substrate-binding protein
MIGRVTPMPELAPERQMRARQRDRGGFLDAMTRRTVIVGLGAVLVGRAARAHAQTRRVARIGVLSPTPPPPDPAGVSGKEALERGLRQLEWNPGVDITIEYRYAAGSVERMREQAAELVRLPVDVIVARGTQATQLARDASSTVPIVMSFVADPVGAGFALSLARPGGNVTGVAFLVQAIQGKQLELLKEVVPRVSRVAVLGNPSSLPGVQYENYLKAAEDGALALKLQHKVFEVRKEEDIGPTFAAISAARFDGLLLLTDPFLLEPRRDQVVTLAAKHRLPAIYPWSQYVLSGGFMAYGASQYELHRRAASYVDRILKGARPGDLPIEQPVTFELVVNLKTAKELRLTIPQSVLIRAERVVE